MTYAEAVQERDFQGGAFLVVKSVRWDGLEDHMVLRGEADLANYRDGLKNWDVKITVVA
tara:strand:- start:1073 stop:1249 length:177 start_codon:yes stop_codon:yes gene_type:complete